MEKLIEQYEGTIKPGNRKKNPVANKLLRSGQKSKYYSLKISSRIHNQVEYRGCKYIRYADDFLVGILGHRRLAEQVRNKVNEFLKRELNIELSLKKAKITHVSRGIGFLGYVFSRKILFVKQRYGRRVVTRKMTIPTLDVNMNRVIARLSQVGFCAGNGNPIPAFRFLRLPQSETNLKVNQILKGLCEWWAIAGNRKQAVARVAYIIRYSIAKVYAAKFKLPTVASVFKIGGNDLGKPIGIRAKSVVGEDEGQVPAGRKEELKGILYDRYYKIPKPKGNKLKPSWIPEYLNTLKEGDKDYANLWDKVWSMRKAASKNLLGVMTWRLERTLSRQGAPCSICGSHEDVQMHHVRPLIDLPKSINAVRKYAISMSRKQVPLCRKHHLAAHKGDWNK